MVGIPSASVSWEQHCDTGHRSPGAVMLRKQVRRLPVLLDDDGTVAPLMRPVVRFVAAHRNAGESGWSARWVRMSPTGRLWRQPPEAGAHGRGWSRWGEH